MDKNIIKFEAWLKQNGAEVIPVSNEHEAIRFKGSETGVVYKSGNYSGQYALNAYQCFLKNKKWDGRPINVGRKNTYVKEKKQLIARDGTACFYCGNLLHDDITLEHLIPLTSGGKNVLSNMVLAHEACNNKMGFKGINEKVNLAIKIRVEKITNSTPSCQH